MTSAGPQAVAARREIVEILQRKGHAVDNTRDAIERLERAFAEGALKRTDDLEQVLTDLEVALEQDDGQKLGGKSAEAARFITRRLVRLLEES